MAKPRIQPTYRFHKASGKAIVTYDDADRRRRSVLLPGPFNSKESRSEYKRTLDILNANGIPRLQESTKRHVVFSVAELIDRYWQHVESYYRRADGMPTQEVDAMRYTMRPLNYVNGDTAAKDFGPAALRAVRELMVNGSEHPKYGPQDSLCRNQINLPAARRLCHGEREMPASRSSTQPNAPRSRVETAVCKNPLAMLLSRGMIN